MPLFPLWAFVAYSRANFNFLPLPLPFGLQEGILTYVAEY